MFQNVKKAYNLNFNTHNGYLFIHSDEAWKCRCAVEMQYLTEMTLSTSFFASWKVFTPSERSMRSEDRQEERQMFSCCRRETAQSFWLENVQVTMTFIQQFCVTPLLANDFTSIEFLIGDAVDVFDWTVGFQRL